MTSEEDPLVAALPPATDYLTYLTILEYQLTPARLPTLHRLLQDEVLTTNIGWDLVQILLPMLPQSQECLQDIARLGNPREVILRVSDSLMKLEPDENDDEEIQHATTGPEQAVTVPVKGPSRYVAQFNCLNAMLSVLHSRIRTKYPSRFIATSLQAALEAYGSMPTDETTNALLELLRDLSPTKRPAVPPRGTSDSSVVRVSQASAPDPETVYDVPVASDDRSLQQKLVQFGLVELLKSYVLSLSSSEESGLSWALRLQEKLNRKEDHLADILSKNHIHAATEHLKERDLIIGKICALSRDLGIKDEYLLQIVTSPVETRPPPLDFDELPKTADEIPLERHGALLMLAARSSASILFSGSQPVHIPVYPDLAVIFANFVGVGTPNEQPQALHDALLTITTISSHDKVGEPIDEKQYTDLSLAVTTCSSRQIFNSLRRIPSTIARSHPSDTARFKLIRKIFENEDLLYARETAVGWLKDEILAPTADISSQNTVFLNPHYFSVLFPIIFNPAEFDSMDIATDIVAAFLRFSQALAPYTHAALSLYYILLSSTQLRNKLELSHGYPFFKTEFLPRLKSTCQLLEEDLSANGGDGKIEAAIGEDMCHIGLARSVGLLSHIIAQVEEKLGDLIAHDEETIGSGRNTFDISKVEAIRFATAV
ncbi:YAP-binding/ALF4/Glomulin [Talaromyces proteolyticus]|uniref:YAP-binding/ALF4/Glomulin n=1 Tax=Talaromyces proteolyticus TaxID=1131652 RepID=A0AAD4PVN8_9EURO|nr:YAP-binding/ALF4/Glomulin [Talaromyces proteolyticus]KAH8696725.1 YAP-binding/ALF4/Glomulin [Talaromyces proteolyticus]